MSSEAGAAAQGSRVPAQAAASADTGDTDSLSELLFDKLRHQVEACGDDRQAQGDLLKAIRCYNEHLQRAKETAAKEAAAKALAEPMDLDKQGALDEESRKAKFEAKHLARVSPYA